MYCYYSTRYFVTVIITIKTVVICFTMFLPSTTVNYFMTRMDCSYITNFAITV